MEASEAEKARMRAHYQELKKAGLCPQCGKRRPIPGRAICKTCCAKKRSWHENNRERSNENAARLRRRLWDQVLEAYGQRCACCGETMVEFLTVDHVDGGGQKHRASLGGTMAALLRWIIKHGFPRSIRILCMNCNLSYGLYGYCPHQKEK
jgi:hypothetical protein